MKTLEDSFDIATALLSAFATNNHINHYLLEHLPADAWDARPPGRGPAIAAVAAHIHNARRRWLKVTGATQRHARLDDRASVAGTIRALKQSDAALVTVLHASLSSGSVRGFKPDAVAFCIYLIAHDAHHRGQIVSLARQLGHSISKLVTLGLWDWKARSAELMPPRPESRRRLSAGVGGPLELTSGVVRRRGTSMTLDEIFASVAGMEPWTLRVLCASGAERLAPLFRALARAAQRSDLRGRPPGSVGRREPGTERGGESPSASPA